MDANMFLSELVRDLGKDYPELRFMIEYENNKIAIVCFSRSNDKLECTVSGVGGPVDRVLDLLMKLSRKGAFESLVASMNVLTTNFPNPPIST